MKFHSRTYFLGLAVRVGDSISEDMMASNVKSCVYHAYQVIKSLLRFAPILKNLMHFLISRSNQTCFPTFYRWSINKFKKIFLSLRVSISLCLLLMSLHQLLIIMFISSISNALSVIWSTLHWPFKLPLSSPLKRFLLVVA